MSSPIFNAMGGNNNMMNQFRRFMSQMQGKNPNTEINKLLQSGRLNQQQLNQIQQQAEQMKGMFSGFFK